MHMTKAGAAWLGAMVFGAGLIGVATPAQSQSADTQYFPLLVYRTGPFSPMGRSTISS
jgi:hypothetical protein